MVWRLQLPVLKASASLQPHTHSIKRCNNSSWSWGSPKKFEFFIGFLKPVTKTSKDIFGRCVILKFWIQINLSNKRFFFWFQDLMKSFCSVILHQIKQKKVDSFKSLIRISCKSEATLLFTVSTPYLKTIIWLSLCAHTERCCITSYCSLTFYMYFISFYLIFINSWLYRKSSKLIKCKNILNKYSCSGTPAFKSESYRLRFS